MREYFQRQKYALEFETCHRAVIDISAISYTKAYLLSFEKNAAATKTSAELIAAMKKAYPDAPPGMSLDIGAKVNKGEMKW